MRIGRRRLLGLGLALPLARRAAAPERELATLLLETPRPALLETLAARAGAGLAPDALLAALAVAGCREVSPYPHVGYKYHAVMMLQSAHLAAAALGGRRAWLPLLWTADYFKAAAAREDEDGPWRLPAPAARPPGGAGMTALRRALAAWDAAGADAATAALCAAGRAEAAIGTLALAAARDFRAIGHKSIAAANAHRLHALLGPAVAAPLARSLALAVQNPEGDPDPARHAHAADADWQANRPRAAGLPAAWQRGHGEPAAAHSLLAVLRAGSSEAAAAAAAARLRAGAGAQPLWEAITAFAAELMLQRNNIIAVHAGTMANAMHYLFRVLAGDRARRLLLLQAAAFMPRFRDRLGAGAQASGRRIDAIAPLSGAGIDAVFAMLAQDRHRAVSAALGWLEAGGSEAALAARARWHAVAKITGTHDIKYTEAALESCRWLRPPWRRRVLAASLMYANASGAPENAVVARARRLLEGE